MSFVEKLHKKNIIAKPGFNRWLVPPASIAIHLCIGSVYAWSMFNPALIKVLGVVSSSGDDWSLSQVVWIFSVAIVSLGLAAAYAGKWLEKFLFDGEHTDKHGDVIDFDGDPLNYISGF